MARIRMPQRFLFVLVSLVPLSTSATDFELFAPVAVRHDPNTVVYGLCEGVLGMLTQTRGSAYGINEPRAAHKQILDRKSAQVLKTKGFVLDIESEDIVLRTVIGEVGRMKLSGPLTMIRVFEKAKDELAIVIVGKTQIQAYSCRGFRLDNLELTEIEDHLSGLGIHLNEYEILGLRQPPHGANLSRGLYFTVFIRATGFDAQTELNLPVYQLRSLADRLGVEKMFEEIPLLEEGPGAGASPSKTEPQGPKFLSIAADPRLALQLLLLPQDYVPPSYESLYETLAQALANRKIPDFSQVDSSTLAEAFEAAIHQMKRFNSNWFKFLKGRVEGLSTGNGGIYSLEEVRDHSKLPRGMQIPENARILKFVRKNGRGETALDAFILLTPTANPVQFIEILD